ncbi:hypothetical protein MKS88_003775 [Plasmodium brasilianum]|uniref:Uncharacterized protein n=1 Tax=Plasmodium brasilianum TaxID=5824 RepID=A0ACB9Y8A8_PLABR|nr:hypothetical protein MKS88_003775 [Plasmodium brasilianum]
MVKKITLHGQAILATLYDQAILATLCDPANLGTLCDPANLGTLHGQASLGTLHGQANLGALHGQANLGTLHGQASLGTLHGQAKTNGIAQLGKSFFLACAHRKEQVNKIVYEYFYLEEKIYKVIDRADVRNLFLEDKRKLQQINGGEAHKVDNKKKLNENDYISEKQLKDIINDNTFDKELNNVVLKHISSYVNSSKYFIHLCVFYIYNNEKRKFVELMKNFNNYCFSYEDLFILFYLICRINYKDMHIIRSILNIFEIYYYKIDNLFSYNISNLFFPPYNNLHLAINNLPLPYKIKLINSADKGYHEKSQSSPERSGDKVVEEKEERISSNETTEKITGNGSKENIQDSQNGNILKTEKLNEKKKEHIKSNNLLTKMDESECENILENLQDVDMEKYEKLISKDSIKFINLNIKKEKKRMKIKEMKNEGLKLKSALLTQIKTEVEEKNTEKTGEADAFEIKEVLTIFINDKKLAEKNYYIKDFIDVVVHYFIEHNDALCNNLLILLVFMKKICYYNNKKLNISIELLLINYIKSMNILSEQDIYNFINEKIMSFENMIHVENEDKLDEKNNNENVIYNKDKKSNDILELLYNQQYIYNFTLYDENMFYENKFHYIMNKILKNYFFLVSYMLRLPFLKLHILKSYLNSFNMFMGFFINNKNIFYSFDIGDIAFICTCFLKRKIIKVEIVDKLFSVLHYKIDAFLNLSSRHSYKGKKDSRNHNIKGNNNDSISDDSSKSSNHHNDNRSDNSKASSENNTKENIEEACPFHINDILVFLHFVHFYNLTFDALYKQLLMICFNKFVCLNDTQQLIFFNSVEGIKRRNFTNDEQKSLLDYFMYEKSLQFFLNRNKNIQKESLGYLFIS